MALKTSNVLVWYDLNGDGADSSPNGRDLTVGSDVNFVADAFNGQAAEYDGAGGNVLTLADASWASIDAGERLEIAFAFTAKDVDDNRALGLWEFLSTTANGGRAYSFRSRSADQQSFMGRTGDTERVASPAVSRVEGTTYIGFVSYIHDTDTVECEIWQQHGSSALDSASDSLATLDGNADNGLNILNRSTQFANDTLDSIPIGWFAAFDTAPTESEKKRIVAGTTYKKFFGGGLRQRDRTRRGIP